jgi:hypothetical protein
LIDLLPRLIAGIVAIARHRGRGNTLPRNALAIPGSGRSRAVRLRVLGKGRVAFPVVGDVRMPSHNGRTESSRWCLQSRDRDESVRQLSTGAALSRAAPRLKRSE